MGFVLKYGCRRRQHNIGEQDVLGVQSHWAVHCRDQRHLDVENVHEDFPALAIDLIVALRGEEVETFRTDSLHKRIAAAGQDDNAVIAIGADFVKQVDELFVGIPVKGQRAAICVKRHFQYASLGTGQSSIWKTVAISVKVTHDERPLQNPRPTLAYSSTDDKTISHRVDAADA